MDQDICISALKSIASSSSACHGSNERIKLWIGLRALKAFSIQVGSTGAGKVSAATMHIMHTVLLRTTSMYQSFHTILGVEDYGTVPCAFIELLAHKIQKGPNAV